VAYYVSTISLELFFLKSLTTLIDKFFLGIANDGDMEAHSEE
jgi:hypothetical protein